MVLAALGVYVYALADLAIAPRIRTGQIPKPLWVVLIILFPLAGGLGWLAFSRLVTHDDAARHGTKAPDDDPDFLKRL